MPFLNSPHDINSGLCVSEFCCCAFTKLLGYRKKKPHQEFFLVWSLSLILLSSPLFLGNVVLLKFQISQDKQWDQTRRRELTNVFYSSFTRPQSPNRCLFTGQTPYGFLSAGN